MDIVEAAPHNYGHTGKYQGVGGHLFAISCQVSMEAGCDGFVAFTAKSDLIAYYQKVLNAQVAGLPRIRFTMEQKIKRMLHRLLFSTIPGISVKL